MNRGNIDPLYDNEVFSNVAVLDAELIADIVPKWFGLKKVVVFTDYNRKVVRFIKDLDRKGYFDSVIVCAVKNHKIYEEIVYKYLEFQFQFFSFSSENSYKTWLKMRFPKYHFATKERGYYHKVSEWLTDEVLAEK